MDAWQVAAIALGPFAGSFVATLVERLAQGRDWVAGRSACAGCGTRLGARDLVPLASYALQRGRCRHCGARIPPALAAVELAALGLGVGAATAVPGPAALAGALLGWWLLAAALLDARTTWLPHGLTWPLAGLGLAAATLGLAPAAPEAALAGAAAGLAVLAAIRLGWRVLRGHEGMGAGDPPLFAAAGAWLGWAMLPFVLLAASIAALGLALAARITGAAIDGRTELPFAPALATATWGGWLWLAAG